MSTWDVVWLNDEIDLLEWRLRLLGDVVDHVLIVEGDRTFSGQAKASSFEQNIARLRSTGTDLHHVVVALDEHAATAWDRENQQRRATAEAIERLTEPGDLVLVCDVDEVPRPQVVHMLAATLDRPVRLHMAHGNYFANWFQPEPWTNSAWAIRAGNWQHHPMLRVHFGINHHDWDGYVEEYLEDAGWHLSFLGGADAVRTKWRAYSHQEYNNDVDAMPGHLERCFQNGVHFQGRVLLRKMDRASLDRELMSLAEVNPDLFRFEPPPPRLVAHSYLAWTWLRRSRRMPGGLRRFIDNSRVLQTAAMPFLLALETVLRIRRRVRPPRPRYEQRPWRPRDIDAIRTDWAR